jgi:DNA-binding transcriptional regulator YhcF (GntR family)
MAHFPSEIHLERDSDVPLGTQLAWQLRAAIAGGALRAGDRLPGVREMAGAAGVNVNTVRAVYARLAEQGVIVSEHGRGTFVSDAGAARSDLGELVERTAREARRQRVDPRELAAVLYARFDEPAARAGERLPRADEVDVRRALRAEIEALEHQLGSLEAPRALAASSNALEPEPRLGARLVSAAELAATRDELAARLSTRRADLRRARASRGRTREHVERPRPESASAWPELLALRPPRIVPGG